MSARTFYLAASSSNVEQAKARIADLESVGLHCLYDWTTLSEPEARWRGVAKAEIRAILEADVFVALSPISVGAAFELGVRVTASGYLDGMSPAHLVGPWVHPFAHDEAVERHESWDAFLAAFARGFA